MRLEYWVQAAPRTDINDYGGRSVRREVKLQRRWNGEKIWGIYFLGFYEEVEIGRGDYWVLINFKIANEIFINNFN
jgi:hypothetical protein